MVPRPTYQAILKNSSLKMDGQGLFLWPINIILQGVEDLNKTSIEMKIVDAMFDNFFSLLGFLI